MDSHATPEPAGPDRVHVDLDSSAQAPGQARRAVRQALLSWSLPALVDVVVLAASELVTNAVRYGQPPLHLVLHRTAAHVRLDLHDGETAEPVRPGNLAEGAAAHRATGDTAVANGASADGAATDAAATDGAATDAAAVEGEGAVDGPGAAPCARSTTVSLAESGRGLDIVVALGAELSYEQVAESGKVVHASFGIAPD